LFAAEWGTEGDVGSSSVSASSVTIEAGNTVPTIKLSEITAYFSSATLTSTFLKKISAVEARDMFAFAWKSDPRLSFRLCERFSAGLSAGIAGTRAQFASFGIIGGALSSVFGPETVDWAAELRARVWDSPSSVYHLPQVLGIALTVDSLTAPSVQVVSDSSDADRVKMKPSDWLARHLPHFSPCSLPLALTLLFEPQFMEYETINTYAIRSLRAHTTEAVVFYLPQLVQGLRLDRFGKLSQFLLTAARSSCMLAHRLYWLCQTESFQDPDKHGAYPPKDPLTDIASELRAQIVAQMLPAQRAFFDSEFEFFEKITSISGVLKPLPTKAARKARIAEEVRKITVPPSLYLPSSPGWQVESIILDSGIPLQVCNY
jgi:hypothetical protein